MAFGCITSAPHAPRPPAFATAMEGDGGQAPAIGAKKIGTRSSNRSQKARARRRMGCVLVMLITGGGYREEDEGCACWSFPTYDRLGWVLEKSQALVAAT